MSTVKGSQFTLYTGDGLRVIGCEESCTLSVVSEEIITTTKGSGNFTNREPGRNDWIIQSNGVLFINSIFDGSGSTLDPLEFIAYQLQGKKVVAKMRITDGAISKWLIGNGVIVQAEYTGPAEGFATFNITIKADGKLFTTSNLVSPASYDGPSLVTYIPGSTLTTDYITALINNSAIYYVTKNGVVYNSVVRYTTTGVLTGHDVYIDSSDGQVDFASSVTTTDTIIFCYDPAD